MYWIVPSVVEYCFKRDFRIASTFYQQISMSQAQYKKRLKALMNKPENQVCSDCPERQPRWASLIVPPPGAPSGSLPIGAFCCLECSGSHRRLGVHISFVRSINLDSCTYYTVMLV